MSRLDRIRLACALANRALNHDPIGWLCVVVFPPFYIFMAWVMLSVFEALHPQEVQ